MFSLPVAMHPPTKHHNNHQHIAYPGTSWVAPTLALGVVRGAFQGDNLLILLHPLELVHAHVEDQAPDHLGDELEQLARDTLARGEHGDLNVRADEEHGRAEHGHGPGLAGTPRHDDQGLLLELLDPKLVEDALPVVFPLILVQLGQTSLGHGLVHVARDTEGKGYLDVRLVELALLLGPHNRSVPVIGEPMLQQLPEVLNLLVSAETLGSRAFGLPGRRGTGEETSLVALLGGQHIVVGKASIVDHGRGVKDHLAILVDRGRWWWWW